MSAVAIGPLVFSGERFLAVVAVLVFIAATEIAAWRRPAQAEALRRWSLIAVLGWVIAARAGFVAMQADSFRAAPLDVFKLWQGGFAPWAGLLGLALALGAALLRHPKALPPLLLAAALAGSGVAVTQAALPDQTGGRLPAIHLTELSGRPYPLAETAGRPLVVNLWATWCPPCRRELPMMMEVAAETEGAQILFVNQGETAAVIERYLAEQSLGTAGMLRDPEGVVMETFELLGLPTTLFFDAEGRLQTAHTGEISRAQLQAGIDALEGAAP
ncbi:TlpA disulfide reductase family protein [Limimaricola cinnabarinus]|uniref:TlpA disulfide reductase family protein n=1 Tax=Limimaricola cinnabarinus TaxID=1125964 RepID=UPI0024926CC9|nr:TlpA disulfide reductase family protein [Limimaricola cinnabarinus]